MSALQSCCLFCFYGDEPGQLKEVTVHSELRLHCSFCQFCRQGRDSSMLEIKAVLSLAAGDTRKGFIKSHFRVDNGLRLAVFGVTTERVAFICVL